DDDQQIHHPDHSNRPISCWDRYRCRSAALATSMTTAKTRGTKHSHTSNQHTKPLIAKDLWKIQHRQKRCCPAPGRFATWYRHPSRVFTICNGKSDFVRIWLQNCYGRRRLTMRRRGSRPDPWSAAGVPAKMLGGQP